MSDKANQSLSVTPPVSGQNTIVLASGTSSRRIKIPTGWKGWITIQAQGVQAWVTLGPSTITAVPTATSTVLRISRRLERPDRGHLNTRIAAT